MSDHTFFIHFQKISLRFSLESDGHLQHECEGRVYRSEYPVERTEVREMLMKNNTRIQGMYIVMSKPYEFKISIENSDAYFFLKVQPTYKQQRAIAWAMLTHNRVGRQGLSMHRDLLAIVAKKADLRAE